MSAQADEGRSWPVAGYAIAVAAVAATFALRYAAEPVLGGRAPYLAFVLPVMVAVVFGGRGPGLLAGLLSLLAGATFAPAQGWETLPFLLNALLFVLVCAGIGWLGGRLSRQQAAAEGEAARAQAVGEELRLLLEGATRYAIFMVDPEGRIVTWNAGAERLFGRCADEVTGRPGSILSAEADPAAAGEAELDTARRDGRFTGECWFARADGSEFLADLTVTPLHGKAGELRGFAKIIHDVTDRRAAERDLGRRERHLQSILATVPDAMIVIDDRGIIVSFSAAAERLFGYGQDEMLGRNVSLLMPSPDRERHDSYIERYLATGEAHIIGVGRIVTGLRADGTTFPMKLSVGEALSGEERLFTGFVQDLTEREEFEARLEQLKSELIHVSRLSAMGTMASTLAHELNQPLTAIASYGEAAGLMLDEAAEIDRALLREVMADMSQQAMRAGTIVRRLREFVSRGELAKTVEPLPKLIDEASALALVGTREKGISAQFGYAPDATPVLVDRIQIQQVLINLMRNAIEAMESAPERRLAVTTALLDPETVQVSVRDTGPGIAPDVAARLFEAFNSSKPSGMGLGLSICRTIVEAHGGRIRAEQPDGGGTEFLFTLPRPKDAL